MYFGKTFFRFFASFILSMCTSYLLISCNQKPEKLGDPSSSRSWTGQEFPKASETTSKRTAKFFGPIPSLKLCSSMENNLGEY